MPLDLARIRGKASRFRCLVHAPGEGGCPSADSPAWQRYYDMALQIREIQTWRTDTVPPLNAWIEREARRCEPVTPAAQKAGVGIFARTAGGVPELVERMRAYREQHPETTGTVPADQLEDTK